MDLNYSSSGATQVADHVWTEQPAGFRRYERTIQLGEGEDLWAAASGDLMRWAVKTRSGFDVQPDGSSTLQVQESADYTLLARLGPFTVREPVRVVAVVDQPQRKGFAYGTRSGHPVSGEEAFIVFRADDGSVWLTLRSLTRSAKGRWRMAFPAILLVQPVYRHRYRRALRKPPSA